MGRIGLAVVMTALLVARGGAVSNDSTTNADVTRWMSELSNWGRWGKEDHLGTFNLITPAKRKQALALARNGISVSLAHTLDKEAFPDNPRPLGQQMTLDNAGHAMDLYSIWYHGSTITHIDALCHYSFEGKIFNGFERSRIAQGPGCPDNGVENQKAGIITRGIIVDIPRMKKLPYLEPGTPVYPQTWTHGKNSPASRLAAATRCSSGRADGCRGRKRDHGMLRRTPPDGTRR